RMACPDSDINEAQILKVFETADNFTIVNGILSLNKAKKAPLAEFKKEANAPIVEKYWKLKTLEGKEVKMSKNQQREIFFTLNSQDNRVTGFAGCNTISGAYTLEEGNRVRFNNMATTMMMCPDVDVNESEFLKIFELADNYNINGDILSLNVGRRAPLAVFEAVYF
ncbi:META domain-containing protein, partial [Gelidibacter sp.]|uniref:META domain-containing protein n=1 Tax=Gelidibacter sp. TaxID=2018083 RepID=UPI003267B660